MTEKTKPETLWVEFEPKVKQMPNGDYLCVLETTIDALYGDVKVSVSMDEYRKLRAAQPKLGLCPSCGKEYDSCKATEKGCAWWCYDCQEKDKVKIRAEGMAQGRKLQETEDRADCQKCIWNKSVRKEAQKQTEASPRKK